MPTRSPSPFWKITLSACVISLIMGGFYLYRWYRQQGYRSRRLLAWLRQPEKHPEWAITAKQRCGQAPFLLPTDGYIGFLWGDSFRPGHTHQGVDIFTSTSAGETPIYAAYGGYLTRLEDWKSSLIIRIPQDPLHPERQIWTYYTHLADPQGNSYIVEDFPRGTREVYVEEGSLLGYQGNYSGNPGNPTGVHLHFSIVKDDGAGHFLNERRINNTLDPSPYLGLSLNASENQGQIPVCPPPERKTYE